MENNWPYGHSSSNYRQMDTKEGAIADRPHVPHIPSAPFSENNELELLWGRMNGMDEALTTLQHGHNLLASALEELKGARPSPSPSPSQSDVPSASPS
jgi:hypothetical protein